MKRILAILACADAVNAWKSANGVVGDMTEFSKAFSWKAGQPMVRENACRVW